MGVYPIILAISHHWLLAVTTIDYFLLHLVGLNQPVRRNFQLINISLLNVWIPHFELALLQSSVFSVTHAALILTLNGVFANCYATA